VVLDDGLFAVTASHTVTRPAKFQPYEIVLNIDGAKVAYRVKHFFWQSGDEYEVGGKKPWPESVVDYVGEYDQLVLMKLDASIALGQCGAGAYLSGPRHPAPGDLLLISGYGEDGVGNHAQRPWTAVSRFIEVRSSGHGIHAPRSRDLFNGEPRADDSGGPVFWPPISNPLPPKHLRLVGIHSGRESGTTSGETQIRYLPIDAAAQAWINRVRRPKSRPESSRAGLPQSSNRKFVHRANRTCYTFSADASEIDDVTMELATKGKDLLLKDGSLIRTKVLNGGAQVELHFVHPRVGPTTRILSRAGIGNSGHWYTDDLPSKDAEAYYLFLLTEAAKPSTSPYRGRSPLVLIEAFLKHDDGTAPNPVRPSEHTISGSEEGEATGGWQFAYGRQDHSYVQDQDDEGSGHEPPG
jgi:hypothetical protein